MYIWHRDGYDKFKLFGFGIQGAVLYRLYWRNDHDNFAGANCFLQCKNTLEQRNEAWWSLLRKGLVDFGIAFLNDLRDHNPMHIECLCIMFSWSTSGRPLSHSHSGTHIPHNLHDGHTRCYVFLCYSSKTLKAIEHSAIDTEEVHIWIYGTNLPNPGRCSEFMRW